MRCQKTSHILKNYDENECVKISLIISVIQILTANIYQLVLGSPSWQAVERVEGEQFAKLKKVLLDCAVDPPPCESLASSCFQLLLSCVDLFWPTASEKGDQLLNYLDKFNNNRLSGRDPAILKILMDRLSASAAEIVIGDESLLGELIEKLIIVYSSLWENCYSPPKRVNHGRQSIVEETSLGVSALKLIRVLLDHSVSQICERIVVQTKAPDEVETTVVEKVSEDR